MTLVNPCIYFNENYGGVNLLYTEGFSAYQLVSVIDLTTDSAMD